MKRLFKWLMKRNVLIFIGLCLLGFIIWKVGPRWPIFGSSETGFVVPLAEVRPRIIAIASLFITWLVLSLIGMLRRTLAASRLKKDMVAAEPSRTEHQVEQIESAFTEAVEALERRKGGKGKRSLVELPWYMVLGPSGVGKTELLRTSGLDFPYEKKSTKKYADGAGGTLNCKWWLGKDAILLDTAGRYVQQDQDSEADHAEWTRFIELLRKHRRRQPLSGLIAVISADDVLQDYRNSEEAMQAEAGRLRQRIEELQSEFNMELPVYLVVSKTDLVAGFSEFFRDLNSDDLRAQPWGFDVTQTDDAGKSLGERLVDGCTRLTTRLRRRALFRLSDEHSDRHTVPVQAFPWQLANLTDPLTEFTELAFGPDQMGNDLWLRGVYLTSATQSGSPIDQLTSELSQVFGIAEVEQSRVGGDGMSYFVRDLFRKKIYPEQDLVGESKYFSFVRGWLLRAAALTGVLAIGISTLIWMNGFRDSQDALSFANKAVIEADKVRPQDADRLELTAVLDYLSRLREQSTKSQQDVGDLGVTKSLGLSSLPEISDDSQELYADGLRDYFVPHLVALMYEELDVLRGAEESSELSAWKKTYSEFELLGKIIAFSDSGKLNQKESKEQVLDWFGNLFEQTFQSDSERLNEFNAHLEYFRDNKLPRVNFTADVVISSQNNFLDRDKYRLAYELMRGKMEDEYFRNIDIMNSPNKNLFNNVFTLKGGARDLEVPGLYTSNGFEELLEKGGLSRFIDEYKSQKWVLGDNYSLPSKSAMERELTRLYIRDYISVWNNVLNSVKVRKVTNATNGKSVIKTIVSSSSPMRGLLQKVFEHTRLQAPQEKKKNSALTGAARRLASRAGANKVGVRIGGSSSKPLTPREQITAAFTEVNALSDGGAGLTQIDDLLKEISEVIGTFDDVDNQQQVIGNLQSLCELQPQPVKNWVCSLARTGSDVADIERDREAAEDRAKARAEAEEQVQGEYETQVYPICANAIDDRFPANRFSNDDISLEDLNIVFGPGGLLDEFTNEQLSGQLNRKTRPWKWLVTEDKDGLQLSNELPRNMQKAAEIRRTFFPVPFNLTVDVGEVDPKITTLSFSIDGQPYTYRQGPHRPMNLKWLDNSSVGRVEIVAQLSSGKELRKQWLGRWALMRALQDAQVTPGQARGTLIAEFDLKGHRIPILINTNRSTHPLQNNPLEAYRCPSL